MLFIVVNYRILTRFVNHEAQVHVTYYFAAVPLSPLYPESLIDYLTRDCNSKLIVTTREHADVVKAASKSSTSNVLVLDDKICDSTRQKVPVKKGDMEAGLTADFYNKSNAIILYTSGTTGKPKGKMWVFTCLLASCYS